MRGVAGKGAPLAQAAMTRVVAKKHPAAPIAEDITFPCIQRAATRHAGTMLPVVGNNSVSRGAAGCCRAVYTHATLSVVQNLAFLQSAAAALQNGQPMAVRAADTCVGEVATGRCTSSVRAHNHERLHRTVSCQVL